MPVLDDFCLTCASVTTFEQPPCPDAHGRGCPEWICRRCGAAVLIGLWPDSPVRSRAHQGRDHRRGPGRGRGPMRDGRRAPAA